MSGVAQSRAQPSDGRSGGQGFRSVRVTAPDVADGTASVVRARDLWSILRGGYCTRWHANPDMAHIRETLAEHHARVAQILLGLHPSPTLALVDAALHHDAGEMYVGDVPSPAKDDNPELAAILDVIEAGARRHQGLPDVAPEDRAWLKFADRLAAFLHVRQVNAGALRQDDQWAAALAWLREESERLGVSGLVSRLLPRGICQ